MSLGHHKKSHSTPAPASESDIIQPPPVMPQSEDLYVSFGSTGRIMVRRLPRNEKKKTFLTSRTTEKEQRRFANVKNIATWK